MGGQVGNHYQRATFCGILCSETCNGPRFHGGGRLEPIEMDGLPVLHVVDAVGAVLLAMCRFHGRIARHASAVRRRPPADLWSGRRG